MLRPSFSDYPDPLAGMVHGAGPTVSHPAPHLAQNLLHKASLSFQVPGLALMLHSHSVRI